MRRMLGFACALAVLFIADYALKNPYWFNEPRHFLGGFLVACLTGACLQKFEPRLFLFYASWPALALMIMSAVTLGVFVELVEYYFIIPPLVESGRISALELYPDTMVDLQMDILGGLVGAIGYFWAFNPEDSIAR